MFEQNRPLAKCRSKRRLIDYLHQIEPNTRPAFVFCPQALLPRVRERRKLLAKHLSRHCERNAVERGNLPNYLDLLNFQQSARGGAASLRSSQCLLRKKSRKNSNPFRNLYAKNFVFGFWAHILCHCSRSNIFVIYFRAFQRFRILQSFFAFVCISMSFFSMRLFEPLAIPLIFPTLLWTTANS